MCFFLFPLGKALVSDDGKQEQIAGCDWGGRNQILLNEEKRVWLILSYYNNKKKSILNQFKINNYNVIDHNINTTPSLTFTTGVIFDKARGTTEQESTDESEDSNNEDNYRNDYPDTEEDTAGDDDNESVSERTMRKAFETIDIGKYK